MTYILDNPVTVGGTQIAVLSRKEITPHGTKTSASFQCEKRPVAVLFNTKGGITAFDISGTPIAPETIEPLLPRPLASLFTHT